eukprot:gene21246-665_t
MPSQRPRAGSSASPRLRSGSTATASQKRRIQSRGLPARPPPAADFGRGNRKASVMTESYSRFEGEYWGSVAVESEKVAASKKVEDVINAETLNTAKGLIKVGPGRREVTLRIRGGYVKVQDEITNEVIHVFNSAQLLAVDMQKKDLLVVYTIRSADPRVKVSISHAVKVKPAEHPQVMKVFRALMKSVKAPPPQVADSGTTEMFPAFYLGFQPVSKKKGKDLILKALQKNVQLRGEREQVRKLVGIPKSCTLNGASNSDGDEGVYIVEQHPVLLVVTERSFRIVDVGACDTVQKFHITQ